MHGLMWSWLSVLVGGVIETGDLVYEPPRDGPTLWEIGVPNRSAAEFYIPDPNPMYINKLYVNHPDRFALSTIKLFFMHTRIPEFIIY